MDALDDWFEYALDLPPAERQRLLDRLRADDPELAARLERALADQVANPDFLCRPASAPAASGPRAARLVRVTLPVDDLDAAIRWYGDVFGCRLLGRGASAAMLVLGAVELQLVRRDSAPFGMTVERDDIADLGPGERRPDGTRALAIVDPWGNAIEVVTAPRAADRQADRP